jgi:hypothetical protein
VECAVSVELRVEAGCDGMAELDEISVLVNLFKFLHLSGL